MILLSATPSKAKPDQAKSHNCPVRKGGASSHNHTCLRRKQKLQGTLGQVLVLVGMEWEDTEDHAREKSTWWRDLGMDVGPRRFSKGAGGQPPFGASGCLGYLRGMSAP